MGRMEQVPGKISSGGVSRMTLANSVANQLRTIYAPTKADHNVDAGAELTKSADFGLASVRPMNALVSP